MKVINYYEFGNSQEWIIPTWACLKNKDLGLINYYNQVLEKPYDKRRFRRPGLLRTVGEVVYKDLFSVFKNIRCLDLPIKMGGSNEYRIPIEFSNFSDVIDQMISFEHAHNNNIENYYAYLTIDQSKIHNKEYQREPGLHVDGFQGSRIFPKVACDRSYIVVDRDPPSFWNQGFETVEHLDESKINIFHEFDRTKHFSSEIKAKPYEIYLMDSYMVHSANKAQFPQRTFMRLSYSVRQYDRLGNSHNNCFDYQWEMFERNIPTSLS